MTTTTTRTWDLSPATSPSQTTHSSTLTGLTLSKRRGQQILLQAEQLRDPTQDLQSFPRKSSSNESLHDTALEQGQEGIAQRTVRRKKSSLDLRDIFLHGGFPPQELSSNA